MVNVFKFRISCVKPYVQNKKKDHLRRPFLNQIASLLGLMDRYIPNLGDTKNKETKFIIWAELGKSVQLLC